MKKKNTPAYLSQNLKNILHERGWSVSRLSQESGVSYSTAFAYVNGAIPKPISIIHEIASSLDISVDELVFQSRDQSENNLGDHFVQSNKLATLLRAEDES